MQKIYVIHNPKCSTSQGVLKILDEYDVHYETILYLTNKLSGKKISSILKKLGVKAIDIIRKKEPLFQEVFANKTLSDEEWIRVMLDHPVLIERPIVIKGNRAIMARPPEQIKAFLKLKKS